MFNLNTHSGFLHRDDHGGGSNAEEFERADAADKWAHDNGLRLQFCSTCFPDNKNAQNDAALEAAMAEQEERAKGKAAPATGDPAMRPNDDDEDAPSAA